MVLAMSASPHFACRTCAHEWDADNAADGCPACGERTVRLTNYLALSGYEAMVKSHFAANSGDLFRKAESQ